MRRTFGGNPIEGVHMRRSSIRGKTQITSKCSLVSIGFRIHTKRTKSSSSPMALGAEGVGLIEGGGAADGAEGEGQLVELATQAGGRMEWRNAAKNRKSESIG